MIQINSPILLFVAAANSFAILLVSTSVFEGSFSSVNVNDKKDLEVRVKIIPTVSYSGMIEDSNPVSFCTHGAYNLKRQDGREVCSNNGISFNPKNIILYHIPKTGGESLECTLMLPKSHKAWRQREQEREELPNNLSVTLICNPFDRALSWFRFCLHGW